MQICVVYMGDKPSGDVSTASMHHSMLTIVLNWKVSHYFLCCYHLLGTILLQTMNNRSNFLVKTLTI